MACLCILVTHVKNGKEFASYVYHDQFSSFMMGVNERNEAAIQRTLLRLNHFNGPWTGHWTDPVEMDINS